MGQPNLLLAMALLVATFAFVQVARSRLKRLALGRGEPEPMIPQEPKPSTRKAIGTMALSSATAFAFLATNAWVAAGASIVVLANILHLFWEQFGSLGFAKAPRSDKSFLIGLLGLSGLSFLAFCAEYIRWRYVGV